MRVRADGRCKNGHLVTPGSENAYEYAPGKYKCRTCHADAAKKYRRDQKEQDTASIGNTLVNAGLGYLQWKEFEARCVKDGSSVVGALEALMKMPLVLLQVNMAALTNYLSVVTANTEPGKNPLRDLNAYLASIGKAPELQAPQTEDTVAF